jgi:methionine-gamma-lyase
MSDQRWRKRVLGNRLLAPETLMMGYGYDPFLSERSLKPPVFHTSTFVFRTAQDGKNFFELAYGLRQKRPNEEPGLIYSRINNPDLEMLEDRLAIWDHAEANLTFASGMAAISTSLWAYARPGSVIVHSGPVYGGTDFLLNRILPQFGVASVVFPAEGGAGAMEEAVSRAQDVGPIVALYLETPANPTNGLVDIARGRQLTDGLKGEDGNRPVVIVDNTMLGPLYQTPIAHGADLVVTSLTKYVGGHSDLIAGGCSGTTAALDPIRGMRTILGTMCDPNTGWLLMRSLETLKLRMTAAAEGSRKVAEFLRGHPRVAAVWYLGFLPEGPCRSARLRTPVQGRGLDLQLRGAGRRGRSIRRFGQARSDQACRQSGWNRNPAFASCGYDPFRCSARRTNPPWDHTRANPPLRRNRKPGRSHR